MSSIGPITKDARALYDVLKELFSDEDRDINGGDLVEFLELVINQPPGTWHIPALADTYDLGKQVEEEEEDES